MKTYEEIAINRERTDIIVYLCLGLERREQRVRGLVAEVIVHSSYGRKHAEAEVRVFRPFTLHIWFDYDQYLQYP